jgi:hypothetical protein
MMFLLTQPWPVARGLTIPAGTTIDGTNLTWNGLTLTTPLPIDAKAMDQSASDAMKQWYGPDLMKRGDADMRHWLLRGPGVT